LAGIKREKRRLDDLLTIKENETEKLTKELKCATETISELHSQIQDWEKRYKHQEKKFEKHISKLALEVTKSKEQLYGGTQSTTGSSGNITQSNLNYQDDIKTQKRSDFGSTLILVSPCCLTVVRPTKTS
jgi:coenzyme F420-reducing hydrogenase alpha subunit